MRKSALSVESIRMAHPDHERRLREVARTGDKSQDLVGLDLSQILGSSLRLESLNFTGSNLSGADLNGAYLRGSRLRQALLSKAKLTLVDLRDADLTGADLSGCDLSNSTLNGARLTGAKLFKAKLVKARLNSVDLTGANLDRADLRGVQGLTEAQLKSAVNFEKAIFDEPTAKALNLTCKPTSAKPVSEKARKPKQVDLKFTGLKPSFGDLFLICGDAHPNYPPTGLPGFETLTDLGIEQVDDYFAICVDSDPVVWIYPLVGDAVVSHHPGPFDGLRVELAEASYSKRWQKCITRLKKALPLTDSK